MGKNALKLHVGMKDAYGIAFQIDDSPWSSLGTYKGDNLFTIPVEDRYSIAIVNPGEVLAIHATLSEMGELYLHLNQLHTQSESDGANSNPRNYLRPWLEVKKSSDFFQEDDYIQIENFAMKTFGTFSEQANKTQKTYLIRVWQEQGRDRRKLKAAQVIRGLELPQYSPYEIVLAPPREPLNLRVICPDCGWDLKYLHSAYPNLDVFYVSGDQYVRHSISEPIVDPELGWPFLLGSCCQYIPVTGFDSSKGDLYVAFLYTRSRSDLSKTLRAFMVFTEEKDLELYLPKPWDARLAFSRNTYPKIMGFNCEHPDLKAYIVSLLFPLRFLGELHFRLVYRIIITKKWLANRKEYKVPNFAGLFSLRLLPHPPSFREKILLRVEALISHLNLADAVYFPNLADGVYLSPPDKMVRPNFTGTVYLVGIEKDYVIWWPFS